MCTPHVTFISRCKTFRSGAVRHLLEGSTHSPDVWPKQPDINYDHELPELRPAVLVIHPSEEEFGIQFSSYTRLLIVVAWMRHFIANQEKGH